MRPYVYLQSPGVDLIRNVGARVNKQNQRVEELVMRHFSNEINNLPEGQPRYADDAQNHPYIIHLDLFPDNNYYQNLKRATYDEYYQYLEQKRDNLTPATTFRIIRSRRPNSTYNPVLLLQDPNSMARRKINQIGEVTNLKNVFEMSKIGVLKSGIKYVSNKNSLNQLLDYLISELLVDTFYPMDHTRPFIIHLDGDITNSVLANL